MPYLNPSALWVVTVTCADKCIHFTACPLYEVLDQRIWCACRVSQSYHLYITCHMFVGFSLVLKAPKLCPLISVSGELWLNLHQLQLLSKIIPNIQSYNSTSFSLEAQLFSQKLCENCICLQYTTVEHPGDYPYEGQYRATARTLTGTRHSGNFCFVFFCILLVSMSLFLYVCHGFKVFTLMVSR